MRARTYAVWRWSIVTRVGCVVLLLLAVVMASTGNARAAGVDLLVAGATLVGARALRSGRDPEFAMKLAIGALTLHWLVIGVGHIILAAIHHRSLLVGDEIDYNRFAGQMSHSLLGGPPVAPHQAYLKNPFTIVLIGLYVVGGATPLVGLTIPVAFATWTSVLTHRLLADHAPGPELRSARAAGILVTVFPTTLLWSCLLLKDASVTFGTIAVVVVALEVAAPARPWRARLGWALFGAASVGWLVGVRGVELVPLGGGILIWLAWLIRRRGLPVRLTAAVIGACAVAALLTVPPLRSQLDRVPFRLADHRIVGRRYARTAEPPEGPAKKATWLSTAGHVPQGLLLVLFRPLPSEVNNVSQFGGVVGNGFYLVLCLFAGAGVAIAWRAGWRDGVLLLVANVLVLWLVLAVADGNAGTAWRHRDAATPLLACFAGIAISQPRLVNRFNELRPTFAAWKTRESVE